MSKGAGQQLGAFVMQAHYPQVVLGRLHELLDIARVFKSDNSRQIGKALEHQAELCQ